MINTAYASAIAILIGAVLTTSSCRTCDQLACISGLTVRLTGQVPTTYRLLASVFDYPPLSIDCGTELPCGASVFIPDFTPDRVVITIESAADTATMDFDPVYRTVRPNGSDCPPDCRVADVEFRL